MVCWIYEFHCCLVSVLLYKKKKKSLESLAYFLLHLLTLRSVLYKLQSVFFIQTLQDLNFQGFK